MVLAVLFNSMDFSQLSPGPEPRIHSFLTGLEPRGLCNCRNLAINANLNTRVSGTLQYPCGVMHTPSCCQDLLRWWHRAPSITGCAQSPTLLASHTTNCKTRSCSASDNEDVISKQLEETDLIMIPPMNGKQLPSSTWFLVSIAHA